MDISENLMEATDPLSRQIHLHEKFGRLFQEIHRIQKANCEP
jgi:hypothetical protein